MPCFCSCQVYIQKTCKTHVLWPLKNPLPSGQLQPMAGTSAPLTLANTHVLTGPHDSNTVVKDCRPFQVFFSRTLRAAAR